LLEASPLPTRDHFSSQFIAETYFLSPILLRVSIFFPFFSTFLRSRSLTSLPLPYNPEENWGLWRTPLNTLPIPSRTGQGHPSPSSSSTKPLPHALMKRTGNVSLSRGRLQTGIPSAFQVYRVFPCPRIAPFFLRSARDAAGSLFCSTSAPSIFDSPHPPNPSEQTRGQFPGSLVTSGFPFHCDRNDVYSVVILRHLVSPRSGGFPFSCFVRRVILL